jgi:hypothetical protein
MTEKVATHQAPRWPWRLAAVIGVWFTIFGIVTAFSPLHMEGGYDPVREKIGATLCSPILGLMGFATFFGGAQPSGFMLAVSLIAIIGLPAIMLFRCSSRPAFWSLIGLHNIVVTVASFGFQEVTKYWSEHP